jgi:hypothetical protein
MTLALNHSDEAGREVVRVTRDAELSPAECQRHALLVPAGMTSETQLDGFAAGLVRDGQAPIDALGLWVSLPSDLAYVDEGDILRLDPPRQHVDVIYRATVPPR